MDSKSRRIRPEIAEQDRKSYTALTDIKSYSPVNTAYTLEQVTVGLSAMDAAQQTEVNRRTGASAEEDLILKERYYVKPWMKAAATPQAIFTQVYYLRRRSEARAAAVSAEMFKALGRRQYALCWVRHKVTRPYRNLKAWLQKKQFLR